MGGLTSAPKAAGVSDCVISRIGTRMSGREPSTYTFDELGNGLTAASSTCAVAFRNFGFAFIDCAPREFRRRALKVGTTHHASLRRHYPYQVRRVCLTPLLDAR